MKAFLLACILTLSVICFARPLNLEYHPIRGVASWYGRHEQGKRMANGQRFDRNKYTCASRYYRLGTVLRVEYPRRSTFVFVRVTDRGPWVRGRVLDLSERAAKTLGLKPDGIGKVEIVPVHLETEYNAIREKEMPNMWSNSH